MFMFVPFLIALLGALGILYGRRQASLAAWGLLVVITLVWFRHHATDPLQLAF